MKKLLSTVCVALVLAACGGPLKYKQTTSPKVPGTVTEVIADVKKDQATTRVDILMSYLPPPKAIRESATTYVAWQHKDSSTPWVRVGALKYDESDRKGELKEATVPEVSFDVQVTAEDKADVGQPSADVIVMQAVNK